jgi:hypothetical protein
LTKANNERYTKQNDNFYQTIRGYIMLDLYQESKRIEEIIQRIYGFVDTIRSEKSISNQSLERIYEISNGETEFLVKTYDEEYLLSIIPLSDGRIRFDLSVSFNEKGSLLSYRKEFNQQFYFTPEGVL